jgi:hypothetical protein
MRHRITDLSPLLPGVFMRLDRRAAELLAFFHTDRLAFHWATSLDALDQMHPNDRLRLSEATLIDPVLSFFSYGLLRADNAAAQHEHLPRAALGIRSNIEIDRLSSPESKVATAGAGGQPALHFVMEASEPNGPLRLARTHFLSNGGAAEYFPRLHMVVLHLISPLLHHRLLNYHRVRLTCFTVTPIIFQADEDIRLGRE